MTGVVAPSYREQVATFGRDRSLVGILTQPSGGVGKHRPVVVLLNSGVIHRIGAHRLHVQLARDLALEGFVSLRFDLSGIGDSDPFPDNFSIRDAASHDIATALDFLTESHEARSFVLMGLCSGAYDAFETTRRDPRVEGAVLIDLPGDYRDWRHLLHHYQRRILRLKSWHNALSGRNRFLRSWRRLVRSDVMEGGERVGFRPVLSRDGMAHDLDAVLERSGRLLIVFSAGLEDMYNHRSQFRRIFPKAAAHQLMSFAFFAAADHTFSGGETRGQLVETVVTWMRHFRR